MMLYQFSSRSDTGRLRTNNEDAVACEASLGLAVLADGMGGYNAGEVASAMATGTVSTALGTWLLTHQEKASARETAIAMRLSVERANQAIHQASLDNSEFTGMGTTLVVAVFSGARVLVGHVGDSRCYRWRNEQLSQLTRDHSLLQEQLDAGLLTPQAAQHVPYRNLVTRALGVEDQVALDVGEHVVSPGDLYLLCSDGLSDMLPDDALAQLLKNGGPEEELAQTLVDAANAAGGRDNISVILVRATGGPPTRRLLPRWWTR
ncbi:Stp1/IreP family PP2C-type Ser/Thr phosphatase [Hydrogenophaga atypica]|uniref:Stp1/IreP family PP2C-type Ser/Thr phosphatase n=1 Tax=Hydrogenophaga atypica TaxID=249409 RepID=A0ABW2QHM4_9BURK